MPGFEIGSNLYQIIIIALLCVGWILHLIGLASPYWSEYSKLDISLGLFQSCNPLRGCYSDSSLVTDWLRASQAFAILAIILQSVLVFCKVVSFFTDLFEKKEILSKAVEIANMVLCFVCAGFIFLSVIIYGGFMDNLSWAWALCIVASLMDNAAGVMTLRDFGSRIKFKKAAK